MFGKALTPSDGMLRCLAVNTSDKYIRVFKGTPLGSAKELPVSRNPEMNVNDIFSNKDVGLPDPVSKVNLSISSLCKSDQTKFLRFLRTRAKAFAKHDYD